MRKFLIVSPILAAMAFGALLAVPTSVSAHSNHNNRQINCWDHQKKHGEIKGKVNVINVKKDKYWKMVNSHNKNFRKIVIVNRHNINQKIVLSNIKTGPGSTNINQITIYTDNHNFTKIKKFVYKQNVNISVNTGNNTVSFNTRVGNITTGDVNISMR